MAKLLVFLGLVAEGFDGKLAGIRALVLCCGLVGGETL